MRRLVCAALVAASATAALPRPAEAWWGPGGFFFGTAVGVAAGTVIGSTLVRPYAYPYYPYPYAYPYYPAPAYAVPYGYPPPVAYYPPPAYAAPAPAAQPSGYVAPAAAPPVRTPSCPAGQFFNTYTGNCDRR